MRETLTERSLRLKRLTLHHNNPHKYLDLNIKSVGTTTNPL